MEFEFKNSFEPDKSESTDPELKLLNDGRSPPESGASVVAGIEDEDDDEDDDDEGDSAFRNESGIIDPLSLPLPLLPLLPLPLLPLPLLLLPLLPLLPNIIYFIILLLFNNIIILIIIYYLWKD